VLGSDLSATSLAACAGTAEQLAFTNLALTRESINQVTYADRFDVVICTGVIHHNAEPSHALRKLAQAMKPSAVLELMVYNRFHRSVCAAFQKAVRLLTSGGDVALHMEDELHVARRIGDCFPVKNTIYELLQGHRASPEEALADALIQPVEYSYTVESLAALARDSGLALIGPAVSEWDLADDHPRWHIDFGDREIQARYEALSDTTRWHVTNLLLREQSPMLWFYFQRADAPRAVRSQSEINDRFLDTVFERVASTRACYRRQREGSYVRSPRTTPFPVGSPRQGVAAVYAAVDGVTPMRRILSTLDVDTGFGRILEYRRQLTTSAFPFLIAKPSR
jgi:SAM-dependent methyltransferase